MSAQNDTIFFNSKWKITVRDSALYYRIKPLKIKTKDAVGYKIKNIDSLFVIKDYYLSTNKIQFKGYSQDYDGEYLIGKAEWYNKKNQEPFTRNFNYKENNNALKFKMPDWPIIYTEYSIANKSRVTAGLEFCLDCKNSNKLFLGAGYGITNSYNGNYYGFPDLHLSYNAAFLLFLKTGITSKNSYIVSGLSLFNVADLGFGYSFPFKKDEIPSIEGFTLGLTLRFTKNQKAYNPLRIMP
ncbi:hypothetical protein [Flavobacterium zhairuonense]|uniref:hypothetical protein n=1 Tax=Flavobacterium zhairuonense TaxID=2493631 RepID=UPI001F38A6DF|nr:hypothetical protein [Flavobacterium zhairuonense]